MKKLLALLVALFCTAAVAQTTSNLSAGMIGVSCSAVATATSNNPGTAGGCTSFNMLSSGGSVPSVVTWQVSTTGSPTGLTVNFMGSLDNKTWVQIGTTSSAGFNSYGPIAYRFYGCVPATLSGGSSPTVTCQISTSGNQGQGVTYVASAPSGTCTSGSLAQIVVSSGTMYTCQSSVWTSVSSGSSGTGFSIPSGALADYQILPTETAAALVDYSGNGNTATGTVGTAPTIISGTGGLNCTGNGAVSIPAAVNSAKTILAFISYQSANDANYYNAVVTGTTVNPAVSFMLYRPPYPSGPQILTQELTTLAAWEAGGNARVNFQGTGTVALAMGANTGSDAGLDLIYVNGVAPAYGLSSAIAQNIQPGGGNSTGVQSSGNFQICGAAAGTGFVSQTYATMQIYRLSFYSTVLTPQQVAQWNQAVVAAEAGKGVLVSNGSTSQSPSFVTLGDSQTFGANGTPYSLGMTLSGWNIFNQGINSFVVSRDGVVDWPYQGLPDLAPSGAANIIHIWAGTNDEALALGHTVTLGGIKSICALAHQAGSLCIIGDMISRTGLDTNKDALNPLIRQYWPSFADGLTDMASDAFIGADGAYSSSYFAGDNIHPSSQTSYNDLAQMAMRSAGRITGNRNWNTATLYTTAAAAPVATTAGSESSNTVTITFSATPANCVAGNPIVIAGTTPTGYSNSTTGNPLAWTILTRSSTQVTFYSGTTGLGAITVQGTGVCPQQQYTDTWVRLGGGATSPSFTLDDCTGYTGQTMYFKNENTTSPWVLTPFNTSQTIDGATSLTMPTASSGNYPVVGLQCQLISNAAGGTVIKRVQ